MAKSLLKTKIVELLKVRREDIEFQAEEDVVSITIDNRAFLSFEIEQNEFCCGIAEAGNTELSDLILRNLSIEDRNSLLIDCMKQCYKMIKENRTEGIITYSNTSTNSISEALKSEFNTEDQPWKLVSEFRNPNSGNTVCYFIARLVD